MEQHTIGEEQGMKCDEEKLNTEVSTRNHDVIEVTFVFIST